MLSRLRQFLAYVFDHYIYQDLSDEEHEDLVSY